MSAQTVHARNTHGGHRSLARSPIFIVGRIPILNRAEVIKNHEDRF